MGGRFAGCGVLVALLAALCVGCGGSGGGAQRSATASGSAATGPLTSVTPTGGPATSPPAGSTGPAVPIVPADVPTTGPNLASADERPPVMPVEATRHTPEGAVAFAKFFELTIDWAYATTSTAYMKHYYDPGCITCESVRKGIEHSVSKGNRFIGGRLYIRTAVQSSESAQVSRGGEIGVRVVYELTSIEVVDPAGRFVDADIPRVMTDDVWLSWRGASWTVVEVVPIPT